MFSTYLDPGEPLETRLTNALHRLEVSLVDGVDLMRLLRVLEFKNKETYEHSVRVALLLACIAEHEGLDGRVGLYAGLLHDIGKILTSPSTLEKTEGWTPKDAQEIKLHVVDGHRILRGRFDFTAEVILWHHKFQGDGYPEVMPELLHVYGQKTVMSIVRYGRLLSLADQFDALHRVNDHHGERRALTGDEIESKMLESNPDQADLIQKLFATGIFTTRIYPPSS